MFNQFHWFDLQLFTFVDLITSNFVRYGIWPLLYSRIMEFCYENKKKKYYSPLSVLRLNILDDNTAENSLAKFAKIITVYDDFCNVSKWNFIQQSNNDTIHLQ